MNYPTDLKRSKVVALLPMKAHSSRVKGKNFRDLAGKPLFRWILDTLLSIDLIDKVVINTDAQNLLSEHGLTDHDRIKIRNRKADICGDNVSMNLVLQDDITYVDSDIYLMTHTTTLEKETILKAIQLYLKAKSENNADSLLQLINWSRFYRQNCQPLNHDPNNLIPTQDLEPWFEENSNLSIHWILLSKQCENRKDSIMLPK